MSYVVKIGGSIATNKSNPKKPVIEVDRLKECLLDLSKEKVSALVFGVGSFGHDKALALGLKEEGSEVEYKKAEKFIEGLESYYQQVMDLVNVFFPDAEYKRISTWSDFKNADTKGLPVYFGSVVDKDGMATILSGDSIVAKIAKTQDIVFYSDVFGVTLKDGSVLAEFHMSEIDQVIDNAVKEVVDDATGGMIGKLEKLKNLGFKNSVVFRNIDQN
jgi:isopentenyl phosphate kinase